MLYLMNCSIVHTQILLSFSGSKNVRYIRTYVRKKLQMNCISRGMGQITKKEINDKIALELEMQHHYHPMLMFSH